MQKILSLPVAHHRLKYLDSLRGLAAFAVFSCHSIAVLFDTGLIGKIGVTPLGILFNGNAAVMFFFVLSGFVLSLPYVNPDAPLNLSSFYIKRIFRIYPAFIFAIIFSVVLKAFIYDKNAMTGSAIWFKAYWAWDWNAANVKDLLKTFLLIGPDFNQHLINPPIWSLVIEMQMSVILPFFIKIVSRNGAALNIVFLFIIIALTYRYSHWALGVFYLGILMAKYKDWLTANLKQWQATQVILLAIVGIALYNIVFEFLKTYLQLNQDQRILANYLIAAGSCMLILIVMANNAMHKFLDHQIFTFLGKISYGFYLLHLPVLITIASLFTHRFSYNAACIVVTSLVATMAVAYLVHVSIEKPLHTLAAKIGAKLKRIKFLDI